MTTIGTGFDTPSGTIKALGIFGNSLTRKREPYVQFKFFSSIYRSTADYLRQSSYTSSLGLPVTASASLKAALELSSDLRRNQDDLIYVIQVAGIREKEEAYFEQDAFEGDQTLKNAQRLLQGAPYDFYSKYGDAYISSALYGREVAIVVKFTQATQESLKKLGIDLEARLSNVELKNAVSFLKGLDSKNLKCEIFVQARGFESDQLPPSHPNNFVELADWLKVFQDKFSNLPTSAITTPLSYETQPYSSILATETAAVVNKSIIRANLLSTLLRSQNNIKFYIDYFKWMGNDKSANEFYLHQQTLEQINRTLVHATSFETPEVNNALDKLCILIDILNTVELPPKQVNTFSAHQLGKDQHDGDVRTIQRISPSFTFAPPPGDTANFSFSFSGADKLLGQLSFHYSLDPRVGYNSASHRIASAIAPDANNQANLPQGLDTNRSFAFHYDSIRKRGKPFYCKLMTCGEASEDFTVTTSVSGSPPAPILKLQQCQR